MSGPLASSVRPLGIYLPRPELAARVVAPQYADPTLEESSDSALGGPLGFLNRVRLEIDSPRRNALERQELLTETAARLRDLLDSDTYDLHAPPVFLICRLQSGGRSQSGIIADVALEAYRRGLVKVHESTRRDQEDMLVDYMKVVRASFLPVFLAHRPSEAVAAAVAAGASRSPTVDVETDDGLRMSVWVVREPNMVVEIERAVGELDSLYVADGHHRAAAAARFSSGCAEANPSHSGSEPYAHVASVLFSSDQLEIHPYDRCVRLDGRSSGDVLTAIRSTFLIDDVVGPPLPRPGEFLMGLAEEWHRVRIPDRLLDQPGVAGLDVSVLHEHLLGPLLGIGDPRTDARLEFVPGRDGPEGLEKLCRGSGAVSFALHPSSLDELMDVADRGEIMPPKSTFFAPKLRSGLIVRVL